jgi:hypothetical protein
MTQQEMDALAQAFELLAKAVDERLDEIEQEIKRLEEQPRQSLAAKLRAKK